MIFALSEAIQSEEEFIDCHMIHGKCINPRAVNFSKSLIRKMQRLQKKLKRPIFFNRREMNNHDQQQEHSKESG